MKTDYLNPLALYWASFNRFELRLPGAAVEACGDCAADVSAWSDQITRPANCTPDALRTELKETGAWGAAELADDAANWQRIIWIAAGNIAEEDKPDFTRPRSESLDRALPWHANGGSARGADMGRGNTLPDGDPGRLHLRRVPPYDGGDYDRGGAYWGGLQANPLYCAWSDDCAVYVRASNRDDAREQVRHLVPGARFFR